MRDGTAKRLSALHRVVFRLTGGVVGRRAVDNDMLLLTTIGRRTAGSHTIPLLYLADGDDQLVVASWGGRPDHPDWSYNLLAEPKVRIQVRRDRFNATASPLAEPERSSWWQRAMAANSRYAEYQDRTERVIPIVRLTRRRTGPDS